MDDVAVTSEEMVQELARRIAQLTIDLTATQIMLRKLQALATSSTNGTKEGAAA
jgi:hypothetical protein